MPEVTRLFGFAAASGQDLFSTQDVAVTVFIVPCYLDETVHRTQIKSGVGIYFVRI